MDEDENVKGGVALNRTSAGAGLSWEQKEAEAPPAILSYDDAGLNGTLSSRKKSKKW